MVLELVVTGRSEMHLMKCLMCALFVEIYWIKSVVLLHGSSSSVQILRGWCFLVDKFFKEDSCLKNLKKKNRFRFVCPTG